MSDDRAIRIIAVGDIMPGGILAGVKSGYVSPELSALLSSGDIRIATLETAIGDNFPFSEEKMSRKKDVIHALDADLSKLVDMGIDVVSLANNHFFDLGSDGAAHAIGLLDELGIQHIGAGANIAEASSPAVFTIKGKTIAVLAFCDWREETVGWCPIATETAPGVNPMYDDYVASEITKYKSQYDYVVVVPHWGREYQAFPTRSVYQLAQNMMDAGACLVLGGHTHCIQPIWHRRGKSVVFSMGNFLFPDRLIAPPRSTYYSSEPIDMNEIPETIGFRYVDRVTLKRWPEKARYGILVEAIIENDVAQASGRVIHLTDDNRIELWTSRFANQSQLKCAQISINSGLYPWLYWIQSVKLKIKPIVKRIYRKLKGINS